MKRQPPNLVPLAPISQRASRWKKPTEFDHHYREGLACPACGTDSMHDSAAALLGELHGLRVSEAFFRRRSELLTKLLNNERLSDDEQTAFIGCCPLKHAPHVVCRACGLTPEEYEAERDRRAR